MREKLEKATTGDIILSVLIPFWGFIIGLMALVKGEGKRGATMIGIGIGVFAVWILVNLA